MLGMGRRGKVRDDAISSFKTVSSLKISLKKFIAIIHEINNSDITFLIFQRWKLKHQLSNENSLKMNAIN